MSLVMRPGFATVDPRHAAADRRLVRLPDGRCGRLLSADVDHGTAKVTLPSTAVIGARIDDLILVDEPTDDVWPPGRFWMHDDLRLGFVDCPDCAGKLERVNGYATRHEACIVVRCRRCGKERPLNLKFGPVMNPKRSTPARADAAAHARAAKQDEE